MMSPVAERIYEKIKLLTREKDDIHNQINKAKQAVDQVKRATHRTELNLLLDGATAHAMGVPDVRLARELRELDHEKRELHDDEKLIRELTAKYDALLRTIEDHRFWMNRADSTDPLRQQEAERKIFG